MEKEKVLQELQPIFQDIFDDDELTVTNETDASQVEDWDSLAQIRLVASIEKKFAVKFTFAELQDLKNVGDMVDLIHKKLA